MCSYPANIPVPEGDDIKQQMKAATASSERDHKRRKTCLYFLHKECMVSVCMGPTHYIVCPTHPVGPRAPGHPGLKAWTEHRLRGAPMHCAALGDALLRE